MKKLIGVVHALAKCDTCGREFGHYKNAQALGAQHAKKYGHVVNGEVALGFRYDGRKGK